MGSVIEAVLDEELTSDALANETALHVTDRGDDGVDLVRGNERGEIRHADLARCGPSHAHPFPRAEHGVFAMPGASLRSLVSRWDYIGGRRNRVNAHGNGIERELPRNGRSFASVRRAGLAGVATRRDKWREASPNGLASRFAGQAPSRLMLGDERHKLIADKACCPEPGSVTGTQPSAGAPVTSSSTPWPRIVTTSASSAGSARRLTSIVVTTLASGAKRCRRADDWGAGGLRDLRDGGFGLGRRGLHRGRLLRRRSVLAVQASRQEDAHQRSVAFALQPADTRVGGLTALLESDRKLFTIRARLHWAADVAAGDRGGRIGIVNSNVDSVLGWRADRRAAR